MKMNKKGFTLIELLAVIVILAIIALIAVPQILNILNRARRSAAEDSSYGILKAAETYAMDYMLENNGIALVENTTFTCATDGSGCTMDSTPANNGTKPDNSSKLDFKGTIPKGGTIKLDAKGNATISSDLKINNFSCSSQEDKTVKCQ